MSHNESVEMDVEGGEGMTLFHIRTSYVDSRE